MDMQLYTTRDKFLVCTLISKGFIPVPGGFFKIDGIMYTEFEEVLELRMLVDAWFEGREILADVRKLREAFKLFGENLRRLPDNSR